MTGEAAKQGLTVGKTVDELAPAQPHTHHAPSLPTEPDRPSSIQAVRAIVTGGAGFIGSHVVDALVARGDQVTVIDDLSTGKRENLSRDVELVCRDVREPLADVFAEVRPAACFHLAAQADVRVSVEQPHFDADVNALGTIRVLEAARPHGTAFVFSSTGGAIYGECDGPAPEDSERRPLAPYGVSKLGAEEYVSLYGRLYGSPHVSLRYANVYGPRQNPHGEAGVVAIFLGRLRAGERPLIYGDGRQTRDFVSVADVVRATLAAVGHSGAYNVGTGVETSVLELYELCCSAAGARLEPELAPARMGEIERSVLDPGLAARELDWSAEQTLEQGIGAAWDALATVETTA